MKGEVKLRTGFELKTTVVLLNVTLQALLLFQVRTVLIEQHFTEFWLSLGQIGSLQATQMSHEATIRNLDQEQSRLKEKISRLEEEREALLNQSQAANEQHKQQVLKLEQVQPTCDLSQSSKNQEVRGAHRLFSSLLSFSSVSTGGAPGLREGAVQAEGALWGGDASLQGGAGQNVGGDGGETPGHDWGGPAGEGGGKETPCDSRCTGLQ